MDQKTSKGAGQGGQPPPPDTIVYAVAEEDAKKKKKKRKRGSSRATRRLEDIEKRVSKSLHRVARGVHWGHDRYIKRRKRSARERRDGALVDFGTNVARGWTKAVKESSPALIDGAKIINTRRLRKRIRKCLRGIPVIV